MNHPYRSVRLMSLHHRLCRHRRATLLRKSCLSRAPTNGPLGGAILPRTSPTSGTSLNGRRTTKAEPAHRRAEFLIADYRCHGRSAATNSAPDSAILAAVAWSQPMMMLADPAPS